MMKRELLAFFYKTILIIVCIVPNYLQMALEDNSNKTLKLLCEYKREVTILDLLDNDGALYAKIPQNFDFCYVIIQKKYHKQVCQAFRNTDNTILLEHNLTTTNLEELSTCEYFDIVLYQIGKLDFNNLSKHLRTLTNLGSTVILTSSTMAKPCDAIQNIKKNIQNNNAAYIAYDDNHMIILRKECKILTKGWLRGNDKCYIIINNFEQKYFSKTINNIPQRDVKFFIKQGATEQIISWKKGINLWTYIMFNGIFPKKSWVEKTLHNLFVTSDYRKKHEDNNAWNFVISGYKITPIDCIAKKHPNFMAMHRRFKRSIYLLYNPPWHLTHIQ